MIAPNDVTIHSDYRFPILVLLCPPSFIVDQKFAWYRPDKEGIGVSSVLCLQSRQSMFSRLLASMPISLRPTLIRTVSAIPVVIWGANFKIPGARMILR